MPPLFIDFRAIRPLLLLCAASIASPLALAARPADGGVLDQIVPETANGVPGNVQRLQQEVRREQAALEKLDRKALKALALAGERAAQVALGANFAKEAMLLGFSPAAANDALADAVHWYSLAASRGFPGAPSLDQAGVSYFPIRIQREPRPD